MKLTATMVGSLKADMRAELRRIERAVPDGVRAAGDGLKGSLPKQVVAAGLGARLSRSWRGRTFANKGHDAASLVWSKAAQIVRAFEEGAMIKGKGGTWLAIPTPAVPKRGVGGKRITPTTFPIGRHGPLRMVRRSGGSAARPRAAGARCREFQAGHRHCRDVRAGATREAAQAPECRLRGRALEPRAAGADQTAGAIKMKREAVRGRAYQRRNLNSIFMVTAAPFKTKYRAMFLGTGRNS